MPSMNELMLTAKGAGASDVHISVGAPPKMRVNGRLIAMNYPKMLPADTARYLVEIMSENQIQILEERGECDMAFSIPDVGRYRVNAFKQRGTAAMAVRLVGLSVPTPEQLGVPSCVSALYDRKKGLVLMAGPAGSGKSTTLASVIDKINTYRECHIITLEDPIEYLHHHKLSIVNQREIGLDTLSYSQALRVALREDPDVLMIGEMNEPDVVTAALTGAERGHLVFSMLHTTSVTGTLARIREFFPESRREQLTSQLSETLEAVVCQQLLPDKKGEKRIPAFEVLIVDRTVRTLIKEGRFAELNQVMEKGMKKGMAVMDQAIWQLYVQGRITGETAVLYAGDRSRMEDRIG